MLINRENILHNLRAYQNLAPKFKFAPVLKSNGYGHGLMEMGKILDGQDAAFLIVDSLYEAMQLRRHGITANILIIGYTQLSNMENVKIKNTAFTITSFDQLKIISRKLKHARLFHLKIDTGMHRQGISLDQLRPAIELIKNNPRVLLRGACSHLADADGLDNNFTFKQIKVWNETVKILQKEFPKILYTHLSNTAGAALNSQIDANTARLGIGLYGFNPDPKTHIQLKPALSLKTVITSLRDLPVGEMIGYNITHQTTKPTKIATVPVGYFEGVDRRLSNKGAFMIGSVPCPIVGRVSMNISSCGVTGVPNVKIEDAVEIISSNPDAPNSVENMAKLCNTIPYDILVRIPAHLRRVVQ